MRPSITITLLTLLPGYILAESGILEEVVVSAQRRTQSVMDIPMSVSVIDGQMLSDSVITNIDTMVAFTPGLSGIEQGISTPIFAIRGISSNSFGIGGEASVGVFIDDAYVGRINSTGAAFMDIDRVEVLRGPQSTLFGRNSSAGAISIVTRQPEDRASMDYQLAYGSFDSLDGAVTVNVPLVANTLLLRANLLGHRDNGYNRNVLLDLPVSDRDTWAGRAALLWRATDSLDLTFTLAAENTDTGGLGYGTTDPALAAAGGVSPDPFSGKMASDLAIYDNNRSRNARLHINWQIAEQLQLKSISAWHSNSSPNLFDVDGSAVFILNAGFSDRNATTLGQELRLLGSHGQIDWIIGASYFGEDVDADILLNYNEFNTIGGTPVPPPPALPLFEVCDPVSDDVLGPCDDNATERSATSGDYRSYAAYADFNAPLGDSFSVSGGLRYTLDRKDYSYDAPLVDNVTTRFLQNNVLGYNTVGGQQLSQQWDQWQPRLALNYHWNEQTLTYASVSRGYKAGGFDPAAIPALSTFEEETAWSYELGLKTSAWQQRARFNATAYRYDYRNYQVQLISNGLARTVNAPQVDGRGLELELQLQPHPRWQLISSAAFSRSRFADFTLGDIDLGGNRTILSPETTLSLIGQYRHPLPAIGYASARFEWLYQGEQYFSVQNLESEKQPAYAESNLYLGIGNDQQGWQLRLLAKNLFNTEYFVINRDLGAGPVALRAAPAYFGIELRGSL
jgi:iron complex outermembrane receptor protein